MKMVMAVVPKEEANDIIEELVTIGHTATFVDSRGGVLRRASEMLFVVVEDKDLQEVLSTIGRACHYDMAVTEHAPEETLWKPSRPAPQLGGAVVFVWDLEGSYRF
jgi:uncharacterized protein YaaQ